jgi:hypothetical protein
MVLHVLVDITEIRNVFQVRDSGYDSKGLFHGEGPNVSNHVLGVAVVVVKLVASCQPPDDIQ